jgi:hypothetical protein
MSFKSEFEKISVLLNPTDVPPEVSSYYKLVHSPAAVGAVAGAKVGIPAAALAAIASPEGRRLPNAALVGLGIGAIVAAAAAGEKAYKNMLEKAHLMYHLKERQ